ncbi:hypothetical protein [Amycolatopsis sp. NPDC051128]|uniref:hypothetical protein n=1 Tax=Amycolatopsis sp. NPDC051128 TaxID=3155412 RepID=UPI00343F0C50
MSSTADARRGTHAQPAVTAAESPRTRVRTPRPWAAPLHRPAAKILLVGGLTLAGWLLGAALSGNTASAAERPTCPSAPVVSTVDHVVRVFSHGKHHKSRETGAVTCETSLRTDTGGSMEPAEAPPAGETRQAGKTRTASKTTAPETTKDTRTTGKPATTKAAHSGGDLLGGLVGGVLDVVGGTLNTVTSTVGVVTDTLSHTVLAPVTQPPANNPDAPALLPLDDMLGPVLGDGSNSDDVTAAMPGVPAVVTQVAPVAETVASVAAAPQQAPRVAVAHLVVRQQQPQQLQATQEQPRDSGVRARDGGGDSTPGLPGGTSAPSAPATTATPGHDGSGGARHQFAVHTDDVTTTQLKLIGASRDHEVDGAGREAALPTTSPD